MKNYTIISFHKCSDSECIIEYLGEHVEEMIRSISTVSKTIRYGEKLLKQIIIENSPTENNVSYQDIVFTAIVFHDIGKAFYKDIVEEAIRKKKLAMYSGHEIISAIILEDIYKDILEQYPEEYSYKVIIPALFAVLFHHHALSIRRRIFSQKLLRITSKEKPDKYKEIISLIIKDLGDTAKRSNLTNNLFKQLMSSQDKIPIIIKDIQRRYYNIREELLRILMKKTNIALKKLMYLTLTTLIVLDYEAAKKTRKQEPTNFGKMCTTWRKYYLE